MHSLDLGNDMERHLQVIDFGLAAPLEAQMPPGCGTLNTIAPECIVQEGVAPAQDSVAVDVWGLGVTLYITLVGKFPFQVDLLLPSHTRSHWVRQSCIPLHCLVNLVQGAC